MARAPRPPVELDAVDEALTEMWMANTLCLTFLTLTAIAFACAVWGAPVVAEAIRAQGREPGGLTAWLLAPGLAGRAHPWIAGVVFAVCAAGGVGVHVVWENRRGKIRAYFWASLLPLGWTLAFCITALLA